MRLPDLPLPPDAPAWMGAAASPMRVTLSLPPHGTERKITPAGDDISVSTPQGHRITLNVMEGGVLRNAKITVRPVTSMEPQPFASGQVAAISVDGAGAPLRRGASVLIEFRRLAAPLTPAEIAGFAIDPGGELHLYPARLTTGPSKTQRIEVPIGRFGTYGAAVAGSSEIEALYRARPTDLLSQLEADLAMAVRQRSVGRAAVAQPAVVLAALQSSAAFPPFVPPLIATLITRLREWDDFRMQNLMTGIQPECKQHDLPLFELLQEDMSRWENMVYQLVQVTGETGSAGAPDEEAFWKKLRGEFDERIQKRQFVFWTKLRILFDALHACCLKTGQEWIPAALTNTARIALLQQQADDVLGKDYVDRIDMCKCTVASANGRAAWRGRITHVETWRPEDNVLIRGPRKTTTSISQDYRAEIVLSEERGDKMLAFERVTGTFRLKQNDVWPPCSPTLNIKQSVEGRYADDEIVTIEVRPDGRYSLSYVAQAAEGRQIGTEKSTLVGDCNVFELKRRNYEKALPLARWYVTARGNRVIQAQGPAGSQQRFKDTYETEVPHSMFGVSGPVKVHVEWDLTRCGRR